MVRMHTLVSIARYIVMPFTTLSILFPRFLRDYSRTTTFQQSPIAELLAILM